MAMQTVYLKEHDGIGNNNNSVIGPWWSAFGSQSSSLYNVNGNNGNESCGQIMKSFSLEIPNYVDQISGSTSNKQSVRGMEQFTIFPETSYPEDCKISADAQKPQPTLYLQSSLVDPRNHFELGFSQPMICAKYPYMDQFYGLFSAYAPQISGRIMLPLNLTSDDGPTYVNAKQYHGIIRRRQSRAKAVLENKMIKRRKPYMHESRHLHAMRRPRGCGGRFLNTRNSANGNNKSTGSEANNNKNNNKIGNQQKLLSSGSQSSEVLQSDLGTLNSSKDTNGSSPNISSEVTSMYYHHIVGSAIHSVTDMIDHHSISNGHDHTMIMGCSRWKLLQP